MTKISDFPKNITLSASAPSPASLHTSDVICTVNAIPIDFISIGR